MSSAASVTRAANSHPVASLIAPTKGAEVLVPEVPPADAAEVAPPADEYQEIRTVLDEASGKMLA